MRGVETTHELQFIEGLVLSWRKKPATPDRQIYQYGPRGAPQSHLKWEGGSSYGNPSLWAWQSNRF